MNKTKHDPECQGCHMYDRPEDVLGEIIIQLDGNWTLNHYGAKDQTFLGWVALQPYEHRMEWADLSDTEARALGGNIKKINRALRAYWSERFREDPIERVYVVCFFEGVHDEPDPSPYHLHIHLIPRPKSFDELLREPMENGTTINAWKIHKLSKHKDFPQEYEVTKDENKRRATHLMAWLRDTLQRS